MKGIIKRREVRVKRKENREKMENKKKIIMVNSTLQQLVMSDSECFIYSIVIAFPGPARRCQYKS